MTDTPPPVPPPTAAARGQRGKVRNPAAVIIFSIITLGIYHYIGNNNQEWNAIMATAVVASVPATVLLILAQRYIAAGVTVGAVKD